jgi:hypothetical protein
MTERTAFKINIRCDATLGVEEMISRVEAALGCSLQKGTNYGDPAWLGGFLGMRIVFDEWRGADEVPIFRMLGKIQDDLFLDARLAGGKFVFMDISQGVIDVLDMSDAGKWRVPSKSEIDAELARIKRANPDE